MRRRVAIGLPHLALLAGALICGIAAFLLSTHQIEPPRLIKSAAAGLPAAAADLVRSTIDPDDHRPLEATAAVLFLSGRKGPRADSLVPDAERYRGEQSARTADALIGVAQRRATEALTGVSESPLAGVSSDPQSEPTALVMLASAPLVEAQAGWLAPAVEQPPEQLGLDVDKAAIGTAEGKKIFLGGMSEAEFRARETRCLATAIYFEARGETIEGQNAVAQTIMNRVRSSIYPDTICGVVYQGSDRPNSCQFSFACDGTPDVARDKAQWESANDLAQRFVDGKVWLADVGYATHYHATYVQPVWIRYMKRIKRVGSHVFYRGIFVPQEDFGLGGQKTALN